MQRRSFLCGASLCGLASAATRYEATWESLKQHPVPAWFEDAKLGIFVHWGLYSVPAWAPPTGELGKVDWNKWFYENPYAEWYLNSLRLKESKTFSHHAKTWGENFDYYRFAETFNREVKKWQPSAMVDLFAQAGARYVVLTTKHHDGYTLWPSKVANPRMAGLNSQRDLVGELTSAVRQRGMKMGLYYSGGLDWTFEKQPVARMADLRSTAPQSEEYARYADAHWRELMARYQPAVLWNDIGYPKLGQTKEIFAEFYNQNPEGVVNNRFGVEHADTTTPEYAKEEKITLKKWESCRGLGFSFGYNTAEDDRHVIGSTKLVEMVVDITSKNGNLLLNVGPRPDGSVSEIQQDRLRVLGQWMKQHGESIYGTRPWKEAVGKTTDGQELRYARKGNSLYITVFAPKAGTTRIDGLPVKENKDGVASVTISAAEAAAGLPVPFRFTLTS
jgi:alpha-L-fucosidase